MKRKEEVQSELHFLWLRQFFLFFNFTIHCIKTSRAFPLPWFYGRKGYISVQIMSFSFGKKKKKKTLSDFIFSLWGCLVCVFKQLFSVFKQHFTHFNSLFHSHVFSQMFSNNNFQFLNTYTKRVYHLNSHKLAHPKKMATDKYYIQE